MFLDDDVNNNFFDSSLSSSSSSNGAVIDNDFFSQLVDDLFLDNEFFAFPTTSSVSTSSSLPVNSMSSSSSSSSSSPVSLNLQSDFSSLSPLSNNDEAVSSPLAYPAPAPLAIITNIPEISRKRSRDVPAITSANQYSFDQIASKVSSMSGNEMPVKKRKEKVEAPIQDKEFKPKKNYIGVTYHAPSNRYRARIKIDNKTTHLGYFLTEYEAAVAYDRAAWELRGTKAHLNFDSSAGNSFAYPNLPIRERCIAAAKSAAGIVPAF